MHNNFYFLRQLSPTLEREIQGFTLVSCFSQNKDELILEFNNAKKSFFLKASLQPDLACISFPNTFHRARKNSVDLFPEIVLLKVQLVRQFLNERALGMLLGDAYTLVFKMHGRQANVLLFKGDRVEEIFRHNLSADYDYKLSDLDRQIDWSYETFLKNQSNLEKTYFTFGKPVWNYLEAKHFSSESTKGKWKLMQETICLLESPAFHLVDQHGDVSLSLLPSTTVFRTLTNSLEAVSEFFYAHTKSSAFQKEKTSLLAITKGKMKQSAVFLKKAKDRLAELELDRHYQQWADLIMANLHRIKIGAVQVEIPNLFDGPPLVKINLKSGLSPQKNAEVFYRKAKNRSVELRALRETIIQKEKEFEALRTWEQQILSATELKSLAPIASIVSRKDDEKSTRRSLPYHEQVWNGFRIWVGKSAKANDELTLKHAYKEDLWLHAKDVAGSHVIIKHQAGKPFPKDVIERAASLAAYHSKRKKEKLCPVTITPKKFVRKRKGDPAGVVVVDREDVIMAEPGK